MTSPAGSVSGAETVATIPLYVGDLEANVSDPQLFDFFSQIGNVVSVRVCKDAGSRQSLGYAYVNFAKSEDADRALEQLNFTPLNGKPIRIMYSHRDPSFRRSGAGNLFVKNLTKATDNKALYDTFSPFGAILSCKLATDNFGQSKGYGFVQYKSEESAQQAIEKLNGSVLNNKQLFVGPFLPKRERENPVDNTKFTNVYVKNLTESTTDEDLAKTFGQFGKTTSAVVMRHPDGKSKCFGFVNFESADAAAKAVADLNGKTFDEMEWFVGKAQKKSERVAELKAQYEISKMEQDDEKLLESNLYIKNLDESINDSKLRDLFSRFGTITSCKVMRDDNGVSKGIGFVAYPTFGEAHNAMMEMRGKLVISKPLFVALAERKADRKARMKAHFTQFYPLSLAYRAGPQPVFYGQGPSGTLPTQGAYGYQPQMMPGIRGAAPSRNYYMPMVQPGQRGPRPGGRPRGGAAAGPQNQPRMPMMPQQMLPRGVGAYHYRPTTAGPPGLYPSHPAPVGTLATMLANASPEQQRVLLGENLYPLVEEVEPKVAGKVTGMLLEMDQTEVLHLLESPDALKAKVAEAMEVLRIAVERPAKASSSKAAATEKLADLSLSEK